MVNKYKKHKKLRKCRVNKTARSPNRLIDEISPYLLQHAYNPVDWYPWGDDAFKKSKKENKPIFLSIGYSTCHWCHVMAHESFEDDKVAKLMNEVFVSIKVDREERPYLDNIYMSICQMMTGSGGWPLTIIMTPDKNPFFSTTYIPKKTRFGRIGLLELIPRIDKLWKTEKDEIINRANQVADVFKDQIIYFEKGERLDESILGNTYDHLVMRFDDVNGGFSSAPKFPTPHNLIFLLRYWKRTKTERAIEMVKKTLDAMQLGGIKDHIGFGFHRYSTDNKWILPHFEKMLYNQAMIAMAYTEAYQATGNEQYAKTAHEIFTYISRDMTRGQGGFYSAEDADSEGKEGEFYLWKNDEIKEVLTDEEAEFVYDIFNIEKEGNYYEESTGKKIGKNILYLSKQLGEIASNINYSEEKFLEFFEDVRKKLYKHREKRIHPAKDDKILTDWNGLMIVALAKGAQVFNERKYAELAKVTANFILKNMKTSDGRLLHRYRKGKASIPANLDDYAFFIWGLLELYETNFQIRYLKEAIRLNDDQIEHFWDDDNGGFYFIADDSEEVIARQKNSYDGAVPSGNSVSMLNLLHLSRMTGESSYEEKASKISEVFSANIKKSPSLYTQFMVALDFMLGPSYEIVIVGDKRAEDTKEMINALRKKFIPNKIVILKTTESESPEITHIAEFTRFQESIKGKATAYICVNYQCKTPTTKVNKMLNLLNV